MTRPARIQRKRTKGWRMPENTVYVGRGSTWGNPNTIEECGSAEQAVLDFGHECDKAQVFHPYEFRRWIAPLRGKNLACWCAVISHGDYMPCHADVLLCLANDMTMDEVICENTRRAKGETLR